MWVLSVDVGSVLIFDQLKYRILAQSVSSTVTAHQTVRKTFSESINVQQNFNYAFTASLTFHAGGFFKKIRHENVTNIGYMIAELL